MCVCVCVQILFWELIKKAVKISLSCHSFFVDDKHKRTKSWKNSFVLIEEAFWNVIYTFQLARASDREKKEWKRQTSFELMLRCNGNTEKKKNKRRKMESHFNNGNRTSDDGGWLTANITQHIQILLCVCVWYLTYSLILICVSFLEIFTKAWSKLDHPTIDTRCILRWFSIFILYLRACVSLYNLHTRIHTPALCCNPNKIRMRMQTPYFIIKHSNNDDDNETVEMAVENCCWFCYLLLLLVVLKWMLLPLDHRALNTLSHQTRQHHISSFSTATASQYRWAT